MNIIVIGCGKIGSTLANYLSKTGHDVSVVDKDEKNFSALSDSFTGITTVGVPIDQDVLRRAGVENCDALAAMTQDDNVNIMVSQVAKEFFKVPKVIARVFDSRRTAVFSHFGLSTVNPTELTVAKVNFALTESLESQMVHFGSSTVEYSTISVPKAYVKEDVLNIELDDDKSIFAIKHSDSSMMIVKNESYILKPDDRIIIARIVD